MELPERFTDGDLEAFEVLFRQFQGEVYRWVLRIVRDPAATEDLTIETFWRIYRSCTRFDRTRSFGAWARRIATNAALDHLERLRRRPLLPLASVDVAPAVPPATDGTSAELRAALDNAFRRLPATLQAVARLALIEERPYAEIAESLGISMGAVKSREFRVVRMLRRSLKRMGMEP
jgi:RNA polymerase sigma-70 factor (ECF subfamily)